MFQVWIVILGWERLPSVAWESNSGSFSLFMGKRWLGLGHPLPVTPLSSLGPSGFLPFALLSPITDSWGGIHPSPFPASLGMSAAPRDPHSSLPSLSQRDQTNFPWGFPAQPQFSRDLLLSPGLRRRLGLLPGGGGLKEPLCCCGGGFVTTLPWCSKAGTSMTPALQRPALFKAPCRRPFCCRHLQKWVFFLQIFPPCLRGVMFLWLRVVGPAKPVLLLRGLPRCRKKSQRPS